MRKHSVTIAGHRTSFSLEDRFHDELKRLARRRAVALATLVAEVDSRRPADVNLSAALRLAVLDDLLKRLEDAPIA